MNKNLTPDEEAIIHRLLADDHVYREVVKRLTRAWTDLGPISVVPGTVDTVESSSAEGEATFWFVPRGSNAATKLVTQATLKHRCKCGAWIDTNVSDCPRCVFIDEIAATRRDETPDLPVNHGGACATCCNCEIPYFYSCHDSSPSVDTHCSGCGISSSCHEKQSTEGEPDKAVGA